MHGGYAERLLAGASDRGRPNAVHHGHAGAVVNLRQVLPGELNDTGYFQTTMGNILDGYIDNIGLVWVDDMVMCGETPGILSKRLLAVCDRLL